ncbi:hypothetical protein MSC49_14360 [Methylosinus sp. C49]|nr:hypothetical protein MSC49_14360 [Methylosinus sp. C49]
MDLDPQFNLTQTLMPRRDYEKYKAANRTIFSAMEPPSGVGLLDVNVADAPVPKAWDLAPRLREYDDGFVDLVLGDFDLVKYSLIPEKHKLDKVATRFLKFVGQAKDDYDLIVIDCNPSSSFITQCALQACSALLVPIKAETYSLLGLELLAKYVNEMPLIYPKPSMSVLINAGPTAEITALTENELRGHKTFGPTVLANHLPYSRLLAAKPGEIGFATKKGKPYSYDLGFRFTSIVDELAQRWGL